MKILTVIGARPQFIKAAALSQAFKTTGKIQELLVHTGQHYDANMSEVFFNELEIPSPAYHLGVGSGSHGAMTGKMLEGIEQIALSEKPDVLLVYGDTNSTLAGALAAAKLHIPIAHVEAGLRSFNRKMPEEINRVLTDHISEWLFCPTPTSVENLQKEGIAPEKVHLVGDVMYDGALHFSKKAALRSDALTRFKLDQGKYILVTIHRAENTDDPKRLGLILESLAEVAQSVPVILPLHPRTRTSLERNGRKLSEKIIQIDPVGYLDMIQLEKNAWAIATDSGGVQKEAYFFRVPCVTLRDETEWVELVQLGWNQLAPPTDKKSMTGAILGAASRAKRSDQTLYGGGNSTNAIAEILLKA